MRKRWIYPANGDPCYVVGEDYVPLRGVNTDSVLWNDRVYQDAGDPRFASRSEHRRYMAQHGLTTVDDYGQAWKKSEKERAEFYARAPDRSRAEDIARAFDNPQKGLSRKDIIPKE